MIYADTESLIKSIQTCEPCPQSSYTKKYQKHEPISFSYYIKCFDDNVSSVYIADCKPPIFTHLPQFFLLKSTLGPLFKSS